RFFFQAEDGIRGFHVTGVQTCALPIYYPQGFRFWANDSGIHNAASGWTSVNRINAGGGAGGMGKAAGLGDLDVLAETAVELGNSSEERRVGKECSCRETPYQYQRTEQR